MVAFLAHYVASLLDPIALVLCVGLGLLFRSPWKGAAIGALAYLVLIMLIPGIHLHAAVVISKLLAGGTFGLIGSLLRRWMRPEPETENTGY